jgi:serine/threonine-protein kinase
VSAGTAEDPLFAHLEGLLALPPGSRAAALAALEVDPAMRAELAAMLAADATDDARLTRAIEGGAARISDLPAGLRLGPWRVLGEIGAGGMGTVFLGERADGDFAQRVAIKVLRGFPTAEGIARLRRERRILAELDHPNIARLLDGGETPEGQPYLVMEHVEGQSLADWLGDATRDLDTRLALFDRLADAVAHAHRHLVIHRDLKPGNVLVRADGEPKLLDFGVARLLAADDTADASTRVASAGWASPEQAAGRAVTTASDVYSLGVILRVLLGGRDDRDREAPMPLADAELRGVVAMATAPDPARRYPSVEALRADLAAWRERRPLRALPDTTRYRLAKFVARHRVGVGLAAIALVAAGAFTWRLAVERDRALAAERLAAENLRRASLTQRFLAGTLLGAGARDASGQPVSGLSLIERAAGSLERELADEPGALAEVAALVAQAYMNALEPAKAVDYARLALEHTPADERAAIRAGRWRLLARNLVTIERNAEAAEAARAGLALIPDPPADLDQAVVGTQLRITLASALPRDDPAYRAAREDLLRYANAHLPHGHSLRGLAGSLWAAVLEGEDHLDALVPAREAVVAEWSADPKAFPTDLAYQQTNLARAYRWVGRLDEAEATATAAEARFADALGERMIAGRAMLMAERALIARARGDVDAARAFADRFRAHAAALGLEGSFEALYLEADSLLAEGRADAARGAALRAQAKARSPAEQRLAAALIEALPPD